MYQTIKTHLKRLWISQEAQDMVEYSLLLGFIALAAVGLLSGMQSTISGLWSSISSTISSASAGS